MSTAGTAPSQISVKSMPILLPKEVVIETQDYGQKTYIMHKCDCISGREIYAKYTMSNIPKLGDYAVSQEVMLLLMQFVTVKAGDMEIQLKTMPLVMQHVPDWEALNDLERAMLAYNFSFFQNGKGWTSLAELCRKAGGWASKISTASLAQLFQEIRQHSKNSEPSTP